jgi:hypothetical protein
MNGRWLRDILRLKTCIMQKTLCIGLVLNTGFVTEDDRRLWASAGMTEDIIIVELNYGHGEGSKSMTNVILKYLPD